jgi:hypothetical protein
MGDNQPLILVPLKAPPKPPMKRHLGVQPIAPQDTTQNPPQNPPNSTGIVGDDSARNESLGGTPFQTPSVWRLTDLEVQAAIYAVTRLPDPFTVGSFTAPSGKAVALCDANIFVASPQPVDVTYKLHKGDLPVLTKGMRMYPGWATLDIPKAYDGCVVDVSANRAVIAYQFRPSDLALSQATVVRRLVAPSNSERRIQPIQRPNIRLEILPKDLQGLATHPDTREVWAKFLALIRDMPL